MKVSTALQNVSRLFLDTAPIVYLVERNPDYMSCVEAIFLQIDNGLLDAVTSPVTLAECLVQPIARAVQSTTAGCAANCSSYRQWVRGLSDK